MRRAARVVLIGGAPCCGKTWAAVALGGLLHRRVISTDDLGRAARALADAAVQPDLHAAHAPAFLEYHLSRPERDRFRDALRSHRALWPALQAVIEAHASWADPVVIEGWALLPELVGERVAALWIGVPEHVLQARVRARFSVHEEKRELEAFIRSFTARSVRLQRWLRQETARMGFAYLDLLGSESPEEVARLCLASPGVVSPVRRPSSAEGDYRPQVKGARP